MFDKKNYSKYIKHLTYYKLVDTVNKIDKDKYPEKYGLLLNRIDQVDKSVKFIEEKTRKDKETEEKLTQYAFGFFSLGVILTFEFVTNSIFGQQTIYQQVSRFLFIIISAFCFAIPSYKNIDGDKKGISKVTLGSLVFAFVVGVVPRIVNSGLQSGVDLVLLRGGVFIPNNSGTFSIKSNFIVPVGYGVAFWALSCAFLNEIHKKTVLYNYKHQLV